MSKVQEKETEMEKLRQLKSELQNMMFDLEKEKSAANELRDKLDAKELATEQLDQKSKSLQRKLDIEVSNKQDLKSELDELKSSSTSIQVVVILFKKTLFTKKKEFFLNQIVSHIVGRKICPCPKNL